MKEITDNELIVIKNKLEIIKKAYGCLNTLNTSCDPDELEKSTKVLEDFYSNHEEHFNYILQFFELETDPNVNFVLLNKELLRNYNCSVRLDLLADLYNRLVDYYNGEESSISLLQEVKDLKFKTGLGLKNCKEIVDYLRHHIKRNIG